MAPKEIDVENKQEIQEELLLSYFAGGYPSKTTREDLTKAFPDLVQKHDIENVFSTAKKLAEELPVATALASSFRAEPDKTAVFMSTAFEVSEDFASKTKMEIKNGELEWDLKAVKKLYKEKHPPKKLISAILQKLPSGDKLSLKNLRSALQKHQTGPSEGKETEMTSQKRSSIQGAKNPMRRGSIRGSNSQGPSGPGM